MEQNNNIEEIKKLYPMAKTYLIPSKPNKDEKDEDFKKRQAKLALTPLGLDDMGLLDMKEDAPMPELTKNIKSLIALSLGMEETGLNLSLEFIQEIAEAIMDVNNFKAEDVKKTGIHEFIKRKQEQIKKEKEGGVNASSTTGKTE